MKREVIKSGKIPRKEGIYFPENREIQFISSGCTLLDLVLGGGYPIGRFTNIVGDKSSGKTQLAMEALANFLLKYNKGDMHYIDAESAMDRDYAMALGIPMDCVSYYNNINTVEEFFDMFEEYLRKRRSQQPSMFVLDSWDAMSDSDEMGRKITEGSYGTSKAKKSSEFFRRLVRLMRDKQVLLIIISQVREKIGIRFGKKIGRSGGKALDFYASQVLWLTELKKLESSYRRLKRVNGILVKAKCEKNKIAMPFRECEFPFLLYRYLMRLQHL